MPHLDDGVLHAMVDGEIPSAELVAVQAHLAGCEPCRARLAEARAFATEARVLVEQVEPPGAGRQGGEAAGRLDGRAAGRQGGGLGSWRRLAWAASVVLAVGLGYQTGRRADGPTGGEIVAVAPAPPAAAEAPAERPSPPPTNRATPIPVASNEARAEEPPVEMKASAPAPVVTADAAARREVAEPSAPAAATAGRPTIAAKELSGLAAGERMALRRQALDEADGYTETGFAEAMALLGGRLRLIDGLVPERLERSGPSVRVTYPGPVYLLQHREGDSVAVRLVAPGVSADSVARLRAKVR